jgi:hypothetical protein
LSVESRKFRMWWALTGNFSCLANVSGAQRFQKLKLAEGDGAANSMRADGGLGLQTCVAGRSESLRFGQCWSIGNAELDPICLHIAVFNFLSKSGRLPTPTGVVSTISATPASRALIISGAIAATSAWTKAGLSQRISAPWTSCFQARAQRSMRTNIAFIA